MSTARRGVGSHTERIELVAECSRSWPPTAVVQIVAPSRRKAMRHEKVPDNPMCPICEDEVLPGDSVIFSHGQIVHIKCRVTNEGITDSVARLLRCNAGTEYCHSCVARLLHATVEQAAKAVTALWMTKRYVVRAMGTCSVCGNRWLTIKAELPSVGAGTP